MIRSQDFYRTGADGSTIIPQPPNFNWFDDTADEALPFDNKFRRFKRVVEENAVDNRRRLNRYNKIRPRLRRKREPSRYEE